MFYDTSAASPRKPLGAMPAKENFARKRLMLLGRGGLLGRDFHMPPIGMASQLYAQKIRQISRDMGGEPGGFLPLRNPVTAARSAPPQFDMQNRPQLLSALFTR